MEEAVGLASVGTNEWVEQDEEKINEKEDSYRELDFRKNQIQLSLNICKGVLDRCKLILISNRHGTQLEGQD